MKSSVFLVGLLASCLVVAVARAQDRSAEADQHLAAGRYAEAGAAYRATFEATRNPTYLKKAGEAYLSLGPLGRDEAIRALRQFVQLARTLEEAQEGEALLRKAEALPAPAPAPVPAPAPYPAPYPPPPAVAPAPAPYPPAPAPYPPAPAPYPPPAAPPAPGAPVQPAPYPAPPVAPPPVVPAAPPPPAVAAPVAPGTGPTAPSPLTSEARSHWFGKKGSIVISAERLTLAGAYQSRIIQKDPAGAEQQVDYSGTDISLLGASAGSFSSGDGVLIPRAATVPRFALDYFVSPQLSIGGFLGYTSHSTTEKANSQSRDQPSSSMAVLGARGGYYLPAGNALGFWLQGGLSYVSSSTTTPADAAAMTPETSISLSEVMLDAAALGVLPVVEHFALTGGAYFDGTLTATATIKGASASQDLKAGELGYGLCIGMLGYLGGE